MERLGSNNKRLVKNTLLLYIRMLFTMAVGLYMSRLVLKILGVSDYGIYNIVGGVVVLISIINNSLSDGTQRFITFEIGKGENSLVSKCFSLSMTAHMLISIIIIIIGETIGLFYVINYLNIPAGREFATFVTYQLSLLTIVSTILRTPYQASVIAYENMSFYAYISIFDTISKLLLVLILQYVSYDKLIGYGMLVLIVSIVVTLIYKYYCQSHYKTCNYIPTMDKAYFKKMMTFFGWNFVGTISTAGSTQVGNMIINYFCGTIVNAAYGVANQVNSALNGFATSFQTAFTPQIVKFYSQNEMERMFLLMRRASLLSFYLLFVLSVPFLFEINYVLGVWLEDVPPYSGIFVILLICYNLIDSLQSPLWKAITATGNIKIYEIWLNLLLILNIPISFLLLKKGAEPYAVLLTSVILNFVSAIIRTIHVKYQIGFKIVPYLKYVILRAIIVLICSLCFTYVFLSFFTITYIYQFVMYYLLVCSMTIIIIFLFGLNLSDRRIIINYITNVIKRIAI